MTPDPGLPEPDRRRLAGALAIAACTSGAPDGERLAAIAAAERLLARHGLKLPDLARPMIAARPEPGQWDWRDTKEPLKKSFTMRFRYDSLALTERIALDAAQFRRV